MVRSSDLSHSMPSYYGIVFAQSRFLDDAEGENNDCGSKAPGNGGEPLVR